MLYTSKYQWAAMLFAISLMVVAVLPWLSISVRLTVGGVVGVLWAAMTLSYAPDHADVRGGAD